MADKVRVMHVISGLHVGGAEMMLYRLMQSTKHQEPVVVSLKESGKIGDMICESGVPVHYIGLSRNPFSLFKLGAISNLIEQYQPDVIQSWLYAADLFASYMARRSKRPAIWNIRQSETDWISSQFQIGCLQRLNAFLSNKMPDKIIYCAHAAKQAHENIGYEKSSGVVISNGIDTDKFVPNRDARKQVRSQWEVNDKTRVIGIVGRYDVLKNQHRFLRVFNQLLQTSNMPLKAVMVGRGIDENNEGLMKNIKSLGLRKHCLLLGECSDIPSIMNGFDINLLTSNSEGWPNVLAEAMSCEIPSVSTNVSDVPHILGNSEYIANVDDEKALINACNKLLSMNNQQLRKVGKQCRQHIVKHFSLPKIIADYDQLYLSYLRR